MSMFKKLHHFFSFLFLILTTTLFAQPYQPSLNIPVTQNGGLLKNPWVGGFDTPIFQTIDLNGDGIKDLFVFEKLGASQTFFRYTTYINNGTPGQTDYIYSPQYSKRFPPSLHDWVLLIDYDCDGKEDIFTYSFTGGMTVYHNDYDPVTGLKFHLEYDLVNSKYFGFTSNLYVAANSQPALTDVDNDGDLDVLTFQISAFEMEYHQNLAMENFGRCDTLVYNMATNCWGSFGLTGLSNEATLNLACRTQPYVPALNLNKNEHLHTGFCLLAPDLDGDGDKDIFNGDINGDHMLYLQNGGSSTSAFMVSQDTIFPSYNIPAYLSRPQLGPYYFDANNDGNKDFIVAPCAVNSRNINNVLFYRNTTDNTTNVFDYVKNNFLVEDMIDVGSGANVTVADIDGDGLQDMIIGNYQYVNDFLPKRGAVAYYRNSGTSSNPSFDLVTLDFANLTNDSLYAISTTFGNLDGDADQDMIIGTSDGYLNYFQNNSGVYTINQVHINASNGNPINVGSYASPQLIDLNRDGKLDLVIGENGGNLNYYENTGSTTNYSFTFVSNLLGGVNVTKTALDIYGYSAPFFYDDNGVYNLYVGSLSGYVYKYNNIDNNLSGTFNLVDSMFLYEPNHATVSGADINNDGRVDLLVGDYAGGVKWYTNSTTSVTESNTLQNTFYLYPNPAKDILFIKFNGSINKKHEIVVTDLLGKEIFSVSNSLENQTINLINWNNGMYICRVTDEGKVINKKFIVHH